MPKNKERFILHPFQCQGCGALGHEDSGWLCDDCKKEIGPNWRQWLEQEQMNDDPLEMIEDDGDLDAFSFGAYYKELE